MDTSDQALMETVDRVNRGVTCPELKSVIEGYSGILEVFEKALNMTGSFEDIWLEAFMSEGHAFSRHLSEVIIDAQRLYQYGIEVFESELNFREWLWSPIRAMDDRRPIDLVDSFAGREWVFRMLTRIEHGVYS